MSGRQNLAGAFAPVAPARGAALQGLLAPKRGRGAPAPKTTSGESEETTAPELIQVQPVAPEPIKQRQADIRPAEQKPAEQAPAEQAPAEQAPAEQAPLETAQEEPAPIVVKTSKATTRHKPAARNAANTAKASELVPGALRNVGVYLPPTLLAQVKDAVYRGRTTYADLLIDAFEVVDDNQIIKEFTPETTLTGSGMPRRAPRKRGEAGIQIQLRLDGLQVAWLDEKVAEFNAPSRSALVSAVLKLHIHANRLRD